MKCTSIFLSIMLAFSLLGESEKCEQALASISKESPKHINQLFIYKKQNDNKWDKSSTHNNINYTFTPQAMAHYKLSWRVKHQLEGTKIFADGAIRCDLPLSWQLKTKTLPNIVYPKAVHDHKEESSLYIIDTIAGIYLGKSKFSLHPDVINLMWHLNPAPGLSAEDINSISPLNFQDKVEIIHERINQDESVQLVALHFSDQDNLIKDPYWLITDATTQKAIKEGRFSTKISLHNGWLPWYQPDYQEFSAKTPLEAYKLTKLAPLDLTKIYDRNSKQFKPAPLAFQGQMQAVYDIVSLPVRKLLENKQPLFVHLLFLSEQEFQLLTLEILRDGTITSKSMIKLKDPQELGLPSALELGFKGGAQS